MAKKRSEHFNKVLQLLRQLNDKFPNQGIARHLADATAEYTTMWGIDDKELVFALERYILELEVNLPSEEELSEIIADGSNLAHILDDDDDEDDF